MLFIDLLILSIDSAYLSLLLVLTTHPHYLSSLLFLTLPGRDEAMVPGAVHHFVHAGYRQCLLDAGGHGGGVARHVSRLRPPPQVGPSPAHAAAPILCWVVVMPRHRAAMVRCGGPLRPG